MAVIIEHYERDRSWDETKPGWHECSVEVKRIDKYLELIDWLYANIGKCERHCRWCTTSENTVSVKFRYEKDYIMFTLRWS